MSQSPTQAVNSQTAINYASGLHELTRLVESGLSHSGHERNCCFLNTGGGRFADVSAISGFDFPDDARALAPVDWDADGDLDLWISNRTGPQVRYLENRAGDGRNHVAFRLVGKTANRDGIGARVTVTLKDDHDPLARTLYAGSGYLSQGTKWLHFGLGDATEIASVTVRWPGGEEERFTGAASGERFRLTQGTGKCEPVKSLERNVQLKPQPLNAPPSSGRVRAFLASRPPMPRLEYENLFGRTTTVEPGDGGPLLVNLWATWCAPCAEELTQFKEQSGKLKELGVDVLALAVDGLGDGEGDAAAVRQFANKRELPFEVGLAKAELIDKLQIVYRRLFGRYLTLPVPTSFLVDKDGNVAAIYLGVIDDDALLEDVEHLGDDPTAAREWSDPLKGRWYSPPRPFQAGGLAEAYLHAGYATDAVAVLKEQLNEDDQNVALHNLLGAALMAAGDKTQAEFHYRAALEGNQLYIRARYNLGLLFAEQGKLDEAMELFRQVLQIAPDYADARFSLAHALEMKQQWPEAEAAYREALRINPQFLAARNGLGVVLAQRGNRSQAAVEFRAVLKADPTNSAAHHNLGLAYMQEQQLDRAIEHLNQALAGAKDKADVRSSLGVALASQGKLPEAVEQYHQAIAEKDNDANIHYNLAAALQEQRAEADALKHYRRAFQLAPDRPLMANALSWMLATARDETLRSPSEAVRLAEQANAATNNAMPEMLDTLAAAYAAAGQWKPAAETAGKAAKLARSLDNAPLAEEIERRLALYQRQQAYIEP